MPLKAVSNANIANCNMDKFCKILLRRGFSTSEMGTGKARNEIKLTKAFEA